MNALARAALYGILGWSTDFAFNRLLARKRGQRVLELRTSAWNLPLYALIQPLYEPVHDALRRRRWPVRAVGYGTGFIVVEYAGGRVLRRGLGEAPWDYSHARFQLHGLTRFDYFPLWAAYGLALERVHDRLKGRTGSSLRAGYAPQRTPSPWASRPYALIPTLSPRVLVCLYAQE